MNISMEDLSFYAQQMLINIDRERMLLYESNLSKWKSK